MAHSSSSRTPHFDYISPSVENILGYPPSYFLEDFARMLEILDDDGRSAVDRSLHDGRVLERIRLPVPARQRLASLSARREPRRSRRSAGCQPRRHRTAAVAGNMAALALRDPLTGLANRRLFKELLDSDLARTERIGLPLAVAFLDLDGLKIGERQLRP